MTKEECEKQSLLAHIILESLVGALGSDKKFEQFMNDKKVGKDYILDVKLIANGVELNLKRFVDHWGSQVDRLITEKANNLLETKFSDVDSLLDDLKTRLKREITKHPEEWEK
jgi:hypothetical protein